MQQAQARGASRAVALVDELNRRWRGQEACDEGPVIIDEITLISPPSAWPPSLRIEFTLGGRRGVWEDKFDTASPSTMARCGQRWSGSRVSPGRSSWR